MTIPPSLRIPNDPPGAFLGPTPIKTSGTPLTIRSPIDGSTLATINSATPADVDRAAQSAHDAFLQWRLIPAPQRGEFVRRVGQKLRERKSDLADLITLEVGKIKQESLGEVQEMIDICDFAVGLSRQLYGLTIASERPLHRMMEQWHPLGPVGIITAFNFPVAVWAWNAMLALVCGDTLLWKPSEKTPLTAIACQNILQETLKEFPDYPSAISNLVIGAADVGQRLAASPLLPLISATGSTKMGQSVAQTVAARLGRSLLELGGNNAMILTPTADLDLATRAITFAAAGTAGQRCTTLRRLIVHNSIKPKIIDRLKTVYQNLPIGDPRDPATLVGPLIDQSAFTNMGHALHTAQLQGGRLITGGDPVVPPQHSALSTQHSYYVRPALIDIPATAPIVRDETFAPILYIIPYNTLDEAIAIHNDVPQGLSSAIFTNDIREAEIFLSPQGSDCGIANVNIGTSGAEIGGAFGGEKSTGGGRESGSDAWKNYMRRSTNTINYSKDLPLAQGINFDTTAP
ncbi:MAG TPA: aldehyde dehydrogenase family protein [Tepidisphaeraceae bacterium]|jgi:aldehyde dehydrogenase (NAD+)|nr:aldehyde dehydrogenase family protein [Tepidisphaeraceae bacterium]